MTSLVPPNATIIPVDTRFQRKTLVLPDVSTNQGRYLVVKDTYGNSARSTILFSTLTGNFFEQSWSSSYIGSQAFGAWHLMNDGRSRWLFINLYDGGPFFNYQQTNIVTRGLFYNLEGNNYIQNVGWQDTLNQVNLSTGLGAAAVELGLDSEFRTVPMVLSNEFFRGFNPIPSVNLKSSVTYSVWISTGVVGSILCEAQDPNRPSTISQQLCIVSAVDPGKYTIRCAFRNLTGGNFQTNANTNNGWANVAWSLATSTMTQYINGSTAQILTNSVTYQRSTFIDHYVVAGMGNPGYNIGTNVPYRGLLGGLRMYSTVLTPAEVLQNYNAEAFRYGLNQRR
jgi:hypothetical protein